MRKAKGLLGPRERGECFHEFVSTAVIALIGMNERSREKKKCNMLSFLQFQSADGN